MSPNTRKEPLMTDQPESPLVLIADDSPMQATLLKRVLAQEGYRIIAARDGKEALNLIQSEAPQLVISDVAMPELDGYELCKTIKHDSKLNHIPVILVTALLNVEDLIQGIIAGADSYITKPFDSKTLLRKTHELLNTPSTSAFEGQPQDLEFDGKTYRIRTSREHILKFLISTYENEREKNQQLTRQHEELRENKRQLELTQEETQKILYNVLPTPVADNLMAYGRVRPERFDDATIMFSDFTNFSKSTESMHPHRLIETLENYFDYFDRITEKYGLEKIKTIGDSYMFAGGLPEPTSTHAIDTALAALDIRRYMNRLKEELDPELHSYWPIRLGMSTGPVIAGIIGEKRIAYDVWGNTVNLASRMETYGSEGAINLSESTYLRIKDLFECEAREARKVKGFGTVKMYFLQRIKPEFASDSKGVRPNEKFYEYYEMLKESSLTS